MLYMKCFWDTALSSGPVWRHVPRKPGVCSGRLLVTYGQILGADSSVITPEKI